MRAKFVFENIHRDRVPLRDKQQGRLLKFPTTWYHGGPPGLSLDSLDMVRNSNIILSDGSTKKSGSNTKGNIGFYVTPDALSKGTSNPETGEKYAFAYGKNGLIHSVTISDDSKLMPFDYFKKWMVNAKRSEDGQNYKSLDKDNYHIFADMRNLQASEIRDFLEDGWQGIIRMESSREDGNRKDYISELVILDKNIIKEIKPAYHRIKDLYSLTVIKKAENDYNHPFSKKHFAVKPTDIRSIFQSVFTDGKYRKGGKTKTLGQMYWGDIDGEEVGIGITKSQIINFEKIK